MKKFEQQLDEEDYAASTNEILEKFITTDPTIEFIKQIIRKLAIKTIPVLILGETGTGKELIAQALHGKNPAQFVAVNCAGIPSELLEAEFFGATKGSYTGCMYDRDGLVTEANGGTLFLDEIGDMPWILQSKLLRFLQNGFYRRLGDTKEQHANCRLVCATNTDLIELVKQKKFREDLYYRISSIIIHIPPLRSRPIKDIELLCQHYAKDKDIACKVFMEIMCMRQRGEELKGNVRELINLISRANILGDL